MRSLRILLFILCSALRCVSAAEVIRVSGYEGTDVNVSCPYDRGYESRKKYLCRNSCRKRDVLITTSETKKTKYSIYDDKTSRIFTVTISDLLSVDAGKYWCGVTRSVLDVYTEVKLDVGPDSCCNDVIKTQSYEGGSVSISCPYGSENQNNLKYLCRGKQPSTCLQQAVITSDNKQNGRFTLHDDKASRNFIVTVTSLTLKDSGSYLCGVHRNGRLDVFSAAELEVKDAAVTVLYILPAAACLAALLILTVVFVVFRKYKYHKEQRVYVSMVRNTVDTAGAGEVKCTDHDEDTEIYENQVVETHSKLDSSEKQNNMHVYNNEGADNVYHNLSAAEHIYCN